MKRIALLLICFSCLISLHGQTIKEKLMAPGAWFLFSSKLEQQDDDNALTQVEFFKKDDVSSLFFDENNRLYSVFSQGENEMNEDLWKLLDDNNFVIASLTDDVSQVMEILELGNNKLVLRYCDDSSADDSKCVITTYFSTKAGWLSDAEIDELNSVGVIEIDEMTP